MNNDIVMPRLSDSMQEGTILRWLVDDGRAVAREEELVEIETDKATVTYAAEIEGVLEILAAEGASCPVGAVIARTVLTSDAAAAPERPAAPRPVAGDAAPPSAAGARVDPGAATPLARRIAQVHGVALATLSGSGPRGRVVRTDVLTAAGLEVPERPAAPAPAPAPVPAPTPVPAPSDGAGETARGGTTVRELTRIQQTIARRMAETKATVPEFQVQADVVMDEAIALRRRLRELGGDGPVPSFNDLVVRAAAAALRLHPQANGSYRDGRFELFGRVNVGIAVAASESLVVPTIFDADQKSLGAIAAEARRAAERVRAGTITPPELSGGTFTVSNLGMFGMTAIVPVINAPQAAILGVGALRPTLTRRGEEIVDQTLMTLTLSCDHRILYGADAASFLSRIRALLETPLRLAL